jgi:alkylation response protein AidB-like acyl-CoA dehydrogenase
MNQQSSPVAALFIEDLTADERERAERVDSVLPALAAAAVQADLAAQFPMGHVTTFAKAGLLGLVIPRSHGGLGGGLRDLAAATFAMGTVCPSTALAFFFHCSSASRGLLALEALEAGKFATADAPLVQAFADEVLSSMASGSWLANFASESGKSEAANITITTTAKPVDGGWSLSGTKSFGCATGVADQYLVTAALEGVTGIDGLALFIVDRDSTGVAERARWDGLGMRATANHGITLTDVFVPSIHALSIPGAFATMTSMSRGTFVGNQLAVGALYLGCAQAVYDFTIGHLNRTTFADTGRSIGTAPFQQELVGEMTKDLTTSYLWMRRQLWLETTEPRPTDKQTEVLSWRLGKGEVCEAAFRVGVNALKACGTSNAANTSVVARGLRDLSMGLVQAFPAEKGRHEAASMVLTGQRANEFSAKK